MSTKIGVLLLILSITFGLLIFEFFPIDLIAMVCMLALGWSGILETGEMLTGFSSNAVIVMMAVMIMGRGIERTGIMDRFSTLIVDKIKDNKTKIVLWMSLAVGVLSGFIQNIGAIALFLPSILNISRRSKIPASQLIMPIGFAAILGGTLTMVGSGPLVVVNDLLRNAGLEPYGMFSVTPIGVLLLLAGVAYFVLFGKKVLPRKDTKRVVGYYHELLIERLNLPNNIWHFVIENESPLVGKTAEESGLWQEPSVNILALIRGGELEYSPWRKTVFEAGQEIAVLGNQEDVSVLAVKNHLSEKTQNSKFDDLRNTDRSGFAEVIIPSKSELAGKTIRDYAIRKRFGIEPILLFSQGEEIRGDISDHIVKSGDTIIIYGLWEKIRDLRDSLDFVLASSLASMQQDKKIALTALTCYCLAIGLALIGFPVALAFLSGAIAMVITRSIRIKEMYQSIEWRVIFLVAGLIPLGIAMQKTGAAAYFAEIVISFMAGRHLLFIVSVVGILATVFSLFMTNVGAIVVLTPIIIEMAKLGNFDPRPMVLLAAVCAANSFIIPTHQVNAFIISPGGYRNTDFLKAGSGMTLVFLGITVLYFYFFMF